MYFKKNKNDAVLNLNADISELPGADRRGRVDDDESSSDEGSVTGGAQVYDETSIVVKNIPRGGNEESLRECFRKIGGISRVTVLRSGVVGKII